MRYGKPEEEVFCMDIANVYHSEPPNQNLASTNVIMTNMKTIIGNVLYTTIQS